MRQPIFQKNKTNINKGGNTAKKNDTKVALYRLKKDIIIIVKEKQTGRCL